MLFDNLLNAAMLMEVIDALVEGFLPLVKFQVPSLPCALRYAPVLWRQ